MAAIALPSQMLHLVCEGGFGECLLFKADKDIISLPPKMLLEQKLNEVIPVLLGKLA